MVSDQHPGRLPARGPSGPAGRAAEFPEVPPLDQLIPLADLPKRIPPAPGGRRLHAHVPYRWASRGLRGVVLKTVTLPGTGKVTTIAWYCEFVQALTTSRTESNLSVRLPRPSRRQDGTARRAEQTARTLSRHGLDSVGGS